MLTTALDEPKGPKGTHFIHIRQEESCRKCHSLAVSQFFVSLAAGAKDATEGPSEIILGEYCDVGHSAQNINLNDMVAMWNLPFEKLVDRRDFKVNSRPK
jgi:hypothetical protein